jgi:hypothetical protein
MYSGLLITVAVVDYGHHSNAHDRGRDSVMTRLMNMRAYDIDSDDDDDDS